MGDSITEVRTLSVERCSALTGRSLACRSIWQGTVVALLKQEGEYAALDEVVVQIETDKAAREHASFFRERILTGGSVRAVPQVTVDVMAPMAGTITAFHCGEDDTVEVHCHTRIPFSRQAPVDSGLLCRSGPSSSRCRRAERLLRRLHRKQRRHLRQPKSLLLQRHHLHLHHHPQLPRRNRFQRLRRRRRTAKSGVYP